MRKIITMLIGCLLIVTGFFIFTETASASTTIVSKHWLGYTDFNVVEVNLTHKIVTTIKESDINFSIDSSKCIVEYKSNQTCGMFIPIGTTIGTNTYYQFRDNTTSWQVIVEFHNKTQASVRIHLFRGLNESMWSQDNVFANIGRFCLTIADTLKLCVYKFVHWGS